MAIVIGIIFLFFAVIDYKSIKSIYSPGFLNAVMWLSVIILYYLLPHSFKPLHGRFLPCILFWVVIFNQCSLYSFYCTRRSTRVNSYNKKILKIEVLLSIIGTVVIAFYTIKTALTNPTMFFLILRATSTGLDEDISITIPAIWGYLRSGMLVVYLILLLNSEQYPRKYLYTTFFLNILIVVCTVAKSQLFFLLFSSAIILLYKKKIKKKHLISGVVCFLLLCIAIQTVRSSDTDEVDNAGFISGYILSGSIAFDNYNPDKQPSHINTLRFFYALTNRLGLSEIEAPPTILPYQSVSTGDSITNVYTMLYPYYTDYGIIGICVFACFLGLLFGFVFKKSKDNDAYKILYSIISGALVFGFFGEVLMANLSTFIQYSIFIWFVYSQRRIHI